MNENLIHSFASKRQALLLMTVLSRTANTGGKKCFHVEKQDYPRTINGVEGVDTFYYLRFLPDVWQKIMNAKDPNGERDTWLRREPPSVKEMSWFCRGYLKAMTGVRPTVL